ncbi:MAG: Gfo/Idh/MocA family oxidoreductase, partial [Anaerolineae bacterium]
MSKPFRAAVIGAGAIATHGHIPGYQAAPDVEVAAICDTNFERAKQVAQDKNIPQAFPDAAS